MFLNNHWKKWFKWFRVFLRTIQFNFIQNDGSHSIQFNSQQFNFTTSFVFIELWFVQTSSQSSTAPLDTKKSIMTSCWRGWWLLIAPVMVELHVFWIIYGPGKMPFNQNRWWQPSRCCGNCKGSTLGRKEGDRMLKIFTFPAMFVVSRAALRKFSYKYSICSIWH